MAHQGRCRRADHVDNTDTVLTPELITPSMPIVARSYHVAAPIYKCIRPPWIPTNFLNHVQNFRCDFHADIHELYSFKCPLTEFVSTS